MGITETSIDNLCKDPKIIDVVLKGMNEIAAAKLSPIEKLKTIHLVSGTGPFNKGTLTSPWTPENFYLTASNKIDRNAIKFGKDGSEAFTSILEPMRKLCGASAPLNTS